MARGFRDRVWGILVFIFFPFGINAVEPPKQPPGDFSALVRILSASGRSTTGSAFVIAAQQKEVFILTAAHVVGSRQTLRLALARAPYRLYSGTVLRVDSNLDLALIRLERPPGDAPVLVFGAENSVVGEELLAVGFPRRAVVPRAVAGTVAGEDGHRLVFDRSLAEGTSGGPLLRDGRVVGLVQEIDAHFTYAIPAPVLVATVRGWGVEVEMGRGRKREDRLPNSTLVSEKVEVTEEEPAYVQRLDLHLAVSFHELEATPYVELTLGFPERPAQRKAFFAKGHLTDFEWDGSSYSVSILELDWRRKRILCLLAPLD